MRPFIRLYSFEFLSSVKPSDEAIIICAIFSRKVIDDILSGIRFREFIFFPASKDFSKG